MVYMFQAVPSAHYQELKTVYTTHDSGKKQKSLDKYPMLCIQFWAPDDGRREPPETCRPFIVINTIV